MEFVYTESNEHFAVRSRNQRAAGIFIKASRFEIDTIFAGYIVCDDEVAKSTEI